MNNEPLTINFKTTTKMERVAFKMQLYKGFEAEYKKRHDEIWPELSELLKESGVSEYSIFLDESTNSLFGFLKADDPKALDGLPAKEIMQRWWNNISDIMESNPDNSPVSVPLKEVFYLP
jgi:L-rhamnose mutarotase